MGNNREISINFKNVVHWQYCHGNRSALCDPTFSMSLLVRNAFPIRHSYMIQSRIIVPYISLKFVTFYLGHPVYDKKNMTEFSVTFSALLFFCCFTSHCEKIFILYFSVLHISKVLFFLTLHEKLSYFAQSR